MRKHIVLKCIIIILFVLYCIFAIYVAFFRNRDISGIMSARGIKILSKEHFVLLFNFVPLKSVSEYFSRAAEGSINTDIVIKNLLGNFLLFAPLGIFIPILFGNKINCFWKFLIVMIITVLLVELLQFITVRGSADIDDIILNTAGACLFYTVTKIPIIQKLKL